MHFNDFILYLYILQFENEQNVQKCKQYFALLYVSIFRAVNPGLTSC